MRKIELYSRVGNSRWGTDISVGIFAVVDDEDYEKVMEFSEVWRPHSAGYAHANKVLMHRLILGLTDRSVHTDHLDHDRLNNQKSNLVACTQAENNRNLPFKGYGPHRNKWRTWSKIDGKYTGIYNTEEEAKEAVKWELQHLSV